MALAAPIISVQDGTAAAASNQANNAVVYVTPGNSVTFALQTSTGVQQASMNITGASTLAGLASPVLSGNGPFSWNVLLPPVATTFTLNVEVTDGNNASYATYTIVASMNKPTGIVHRARGVTTTNESLTAFVGVTGGTPRDGVTYVQGDVVLLVGQTSKLQNGPYVVGLVAAGTAALTRSVDYPSGAVFASSDKQVCEVAEGTLFAGTMWKVTTTGAITVDTTNHDFYPRQVTQSVVLVAGTVTVTNVPILSATKSNFIGTRTTANTTASTVAYNAVGAVTPGIVGTASLVFDACVAAGTINAADISTLALTIVNF